MFTLVVWFVWLIWSGPKRKIVHLVLVRLAFTLAFLTANLKIPNLKAYWYVHNLIGRLEWRIFCDGTYRTPQTKGVRGVRLKAVACTQCFPHIDFTSAGRPGILTAAQVYLVTHFCFYYYYYLLHILSARDNETIRDRLTSGKSPLAQRVSYCSFCVLKNCRHSHNLLCFPYADLFVAGRNNIHRPLPSAPASHTIFSNFQTVLAAFFPIIGTYWQT